MQNAAKHIISVHSRALPDSPNNIMIFDNAC